MSEHDVIYLALIKGLKRDLELVWNEGRYGAVLVQMYAGMDAMAALARPADVKRATRTHFKDWVEKYMPIEGLKRGELYSARCGVLHTYSPESDSTKDGKARRISYTDTAPQPLFTSEEHPEDVVVSIGHLVEAFINGQARFISDVYDDPDRLALVKDRVRMLFVTLDISKGEPE